MAEVLVIPRQSMADLPLEGVWPLAQGSMPTGYRWLPRAQAEQDEAFLQIIPYLLLRDRQGAIWSYRRTGGDRRLTGRSSCGLGGHIDREDEQARLIDTIRLALHRELREELENPPEGDCQMRSWLYEGHSAVGRVHLGAVHTLCWEAEAMPLPRAGEALEGIGFMPPEAIARNADFELWSRLAAASLT